MPKVFEGIPLPLMLLVARVTVLQSPRRRANAFSVQDCSELITRFLTQYAILIYILVYILFYNINTKSIIREPIGMKK